MLDPIADKVLVAVVLLVLSADGILNGGHRWAAIIILSREVLVSGLREYLGELQVSVPVTRIAKWKTTNKYSDYNCHIQVSLGHKPKA